MRITHLLTFASAICIFYACDEQTNKRIISSSSEKTSPHIRHIEDTIGFAQYAWQMDTIMSRIDAADKQLNDQVYKAVINPHDDYAYAGGLYAKTLSGIKAHTVVMIGVAHRARNFELKDKVIFGSYDAWQSPYGTVSISKSRDALLRKLHPNTFEVHDEMIQLEHSLEAIVPFIQRQDRTVEIIPMVVPYMKLEDMKTFSEDISAALQELMLENNWDYGEDLAIVISNDAIHYGDEDWGSSELAPFGVEEVGNERAKQKDLSLIETTLVGSISEQKIRTFNFVTVDQDDYRHYNWTWCGRYSVPFGMLVANKLNQKIYNESLMGTFIDYRSSLHNPHIEVEDIGMGHTAIANNRHWVAYVGMSYQ